MRRLLDVFASDGVEMAGWSLLSDVRGISSSGIMTANGDRGGWIVKGQSDRDGDGLYDHWETAGIDFNRDGTVDLLLPDADPDHKDVYLEVDYMDCLLGGCAPLDGHNHLPARDVIEAVAKAFDEAPVENPDGVTGIHLHVDWASADPLPEVDPILFLARGPGALDDFDDLKALFFGTDAERNARKPGGASNAANVLGAKRRAYRYAIFGHDFAPVRGASGWAEIGGNDLVVTLGGWDARMVAAAGGLGEAAKGTLLHELGHTLGLRHGGRDDINCKPNYLSVMSYAYQTRAADPKRPLEYSGAKLATLDETKLDETLGIRGPAGRVVVHGIGQSGRLPAKLPAADGPVDWNGDGDAADADATTAAGEPDPNFIRILVGPGDLRTLCPRSPDEILAGFEDWPNLVYNFRLSPEYADGLRSSSLDAELTGEEVLGLALSIDYDSDGLSNAEDNCPADSNPAQEDSDSDGVGDACEAGGSTAGLQRPGDSNQDGRLDLSDGVYLLGYLFQGSVARLPCGDGTLGEAGNVRLLDSNGDGSVDLSDAVHVFGYLFLGSALPALGSAWTPIEGCPENGARCGA
ncbi:MAG: hypothetical protein HY721_24285 [Planctomycetes bacterium]|nr:hypothetical protein [Planctomycetota bacterium]